MKTGNLTELRNRIEQEARNLGMRVFGVADLKPAKSFIRKQDPNFAAVVKY